MLNYLQKSVEFKILVTPLRDLCVFLDFYKSNRFKRATLIQSFFVYKRAYNLVLVTISLRTNFINIGVLNLYASSQNAIGLVISKTLNSKAFYTCWDTNQK